MKNKVFVLFFLATAVACLGLVGLDLNVHNVRAGTNNNQCTISPNGGTWKYATPVFITCGSDITIATYRWDKSPLTTFTGSIMATYSADKKRQLNVTYKYNVTSSSGKITEKSGSVSKTFDINSNQNTCTISPKGGVFPDDTTVVIKCGSSVTQASWQWGKDLANNFDRAAYLPYVADSPKILTINYSYNQLSGKTTQIKTGKITANFSIQKCYDSDNGINYEVAGYVDYAKGGAIKRYNDTCNKQYLTEYYCASDGTLKTKKAKCLRGCINGACLP